MNCSEGLVNPLCPRSCPHKGPSEHPWGWTLLQRSPALLQRWRRFWQWVGGGQGVKCDPVMPGPVQLIHPVAWGGHGQGSRHGEGHYSRHKLQGKKSSIIHTGFWWLQTCPIPTCRPTFNFEVLVFPVCLLGQFPSLVLSADLWLSAVS